MNPIAERALDLPARLWILVAVALATLLAASLLLWSARGSSADGASDSVRVLDIGL